MHSPAALVFPDHAPIIPALPPLRSDGDPPLAVPAIREPIAVLH